jgi:hypothetical protein
MAVVFICVRAYNPSDPPAEFISASLMLGVPLLIDPLNCRGGCYFVLIQSNQKSSRQKGFFAAPGLCPANRAEPRAGIFCPTSFAHCLRFCKISYAPATHEATIVLPAFARSCFADAGKKKKSCQSTSAGARVPRVISHVASLFNSPPTSLRWSTLSLRKEGEKKIEAKPSFRAAKRGWSSEAMTG